MTIGLEHLSDPLWLLHRKLRIPALSVVKVETTLLIVAHSLKRSRIQLVR